MEPTKEEARIIKTYLTTLRNKVLQHINSLELQGIDLTTESLSQAVFGLDQENHSLVELFEYHNERMKSLVGIDFAIGTYKRYVVTLGKVEAFIKKHFKKNDISIDELELN